MPNTKPAKQKPRAAKPTPADEKAAATLRRLWAAHIHAATARGERVTQETAGLAMGMTQGAVSQFLKGSIGLGYGPTMKFAAYLGVAPTDIRADLESLPQDGAKPSQKDEIAELRMDILALRTIVTTLASVVAETLPTVGAELVATLRHPNAKQPANKGYLADFLGTLDRVRSVTAQTSKRASSAGVRRLRT